MNFESELRENSKKEFIQPKDWNIISAFRSSTLKYWLLVIIFSSLSGLLASAIGFYYMFFIK